MIEQADPIESRRAGTGARGVEVQSRARDAGPGPSPARSAAFLADRTRRRRPTPESVRRWAAEKLAEEARFGHGFLWIPVLMAAGSAAGLSAPRDIPLGAILIPLGALAVLAWRMRVAGHRGTAIAIGAAALFAGLAAAALQVAIWQTPVLDGPVVTHLRGVVLSREAAGGTAWRYVVQVSSTSGPVIHRPPDRVRLVSRGRQAPIDPGQGISGVARLLPPSGPVLPGGYDFGFNAYFQGIGAIGFFYGPPHRDPTAERPPGIVARAELSIAALRQSIDGRIRAVLPGEEGALAAALIVADRRAIPDPTVAALRDAGLAHILAISGLHMVLVAGTVFFALRFLLGFSTRVAEGLPVKKLAAGAALAVATAYLAISGMAVSTLRAWIMLSIVLVAVLLDRPALTLRNVAIAALVIVATNPAAVVGPSFQMSFAATTALIAGYSALRQVRRHAPAASSPLWIVARFAGAILFTSLVAGFATGIFAAYHFQRVATLGILGNLLAMPFITFLVMPAGLVATLLMPYGLESWPLTLMGEGLRIVIGIAYRVQALGGSVMTGRMPVAVLILFIVGFTLLVLLRSRLRLAGILGIVAACALDMSALAPRRPDILVSEDGRLVGLLTKAGIATNSPRPSSFVLGQWSSALAERRTVPSKKLPAMGTRKPKGRARGRTERQAADPKAIEAMRAAVERREAGFICYARQWCAATVSGGLPIVTVADPAYVGTACDLARIVVVSKPIRLAACRSGALLLTGRTLRGSGSVEIAVDGIVPSESRPDIPSRGRRRARPPPEGAKAPAAYRLTITTALGGVLRPWTVQRYYDWHSRGFDFAGVGTKRSTLVIPAD